MGKKRLLKLPIAEPFPSNRVTIPVVPVLYYVRPNNVRTNTSIHSARVNTRGYLTSHGTKKII